LCKLRLSLAERLSWRLNPAPEKAYSGSAIILRHAANAEQSMTAEEERAHSFR
jgi:hypothetical protein